jgi:hypothetical protein
MQALFLLGIVDLTSKNNKGFWKKHEYILHIWSNN